MAIAPIHGVRTGSVSLGLSTLRYVVSGQEVVNAIAQNDVMEKVTIERVGKAAKAWDATKVLEENKAKFGPSRR